MKQTIQSSLYIFIGFVFALTITSVSAWTGNNATPPGNNAPAPLNVTSNAQYKQGALSLGTASLPTTGSILDVNGTIFGKGLLVNGAFQLIDGTEGEGKVLTSDAGGVATWQTPTGGEGTGQVQTFLLDEPWPLPSTTGDQASGQRRRTFNFRTEHLVQPGATEILVYSVVNLGYIHYKWPEHSTWKMLNVRFSGEDAIEKNSTWLPLNPNGEIEFNYSRVLPLDHLDLQSFGLWMYGFRRTVN